LWNIILCHIILCHVMSYIVLYYFILCYVRSLFSYIAVHVGHQQMALEANTQIYGNFGVTLTNKGWIFLLIHVLLNKNYVLKYIRCTSTKSPPFSIITFSVLLTNCRVLLPQSHDYSCCLTEEYWLLHHSDSTNALI